MCLLCGLLRITNLQFLRQFGLFGDLLRWCEWRPSGAGSRLVCMSWLPKKSIVVPVDFSESAYSAVEVALQLADEPAHIHVVHVSQPMHVAAPSIVFNAADEEQRQTNAKLTIAKEMTKRGLKGVTLKMAAGHPAREIVKLADEVGAELIVIPSHGRSGFERVLLGSVTEKVLRLAKCEVLVLRVTETSEA